MPPRRWRALGSAAYRWGKRLAPVAISVGLVAWLVWTVTPARLAEAFATTAWPWLVFATLVQLVVLFLWDTACMWWLFSQPDQPLPFRTVLRVRAETVLWSAINLEVGQGAFALGIARARGKPVSRALGLCVLLGMFDFGTLQALALAGSFVKPDPLTAWLRWMCVVVVGGLLGLALLAHFLPVRWRRWLEERPWASWLAWWNWRRSLVLGALRLVMFLLVLLYAGVGLAICRVPAGPREVIGLIPFVLLAESLPGTGGLGERETALVYLLRPADKGQRAVLLSFGLIWSTVVILGRVAIGLGSRFLPGAESPAEGPRS